MPGAGLQVVQVEDHLYQLDDEELKKILLGEIKDLPVVVVSVAGAFRGGKSFLLNFFLRYLSAPQSSQTDGSWIGDGATPLEGFSWRGGTKRNTTGIVIWSEPVITTLASGQKAAILLMDTQGTFDSSSTVRDCSTIFALSTLLSSIQIYNLSQNIREDDLQHLQLFTEFGKLIKDDSEKAFQALEFLVRDWPYASEFGYGSRGGNLFLKEKLQTSPDQAKELRYLREHIRGSFTSVSCFLLPHPGLEVVNPNFDGKNDAITSDFKTHIKELVTYLFGPKMLRPKEINGQIVKAGELFTYFQAYMRIFNSDQIPTPSSIMQATADAGMLSAFEEARRIYEKGMDDDCGSAQPSVPAHDLKELHEKHVATAIDAFNNKKKMGSKKQTKKYLKNLKEEFEKRLPQYVDLNIGKTQKTINKAKELYEAKIGQINGDQMLCIHPFDLDHIHQEALGAAVELYDRNRKWISKTSKKRDKERDAFIKSFEKQYLLLRLTNEQNNKHVVAEMRLEYWNTMQRNCCSETPLSESEFLGEHKKALAQALENFAKKRNHPDSHEEDEYKTVLIEIICTYFDQMKTINQSKKRVALQSAVRAYDDYMASSWDSQKVCLHPDTVLSEQTEGEQRALTAFRPTKVSAGNVDFDITDEDENTLFEILQERYEEIKKTNDSANETAVRAALNVYISQMDYNCGFSYWWLLLIPFIVNVANVQYYHSQSKSRAENEFHNRRRPDEDEDPSTDCFYQKLQSEISKARKNYHQPKK